LLYNQIWKSQSNTANTAHTVGIKWSKVSTVRSKRKKEKKKKEKASNTSNNSSADKPSNEIKHIELTSLVSNSFIKNNFNFSLCVSDLIKTHNDQNINMSR
jgi:hypothetical protein